MKIHCVTYLTNTLSQLRSLGRHTCLFMCNHWWISPSISHLLYSFLLYSRSKISQVGISDLWLFQVSPVKPAV